MKAVGDFFYNIKNFFATIWDVEITSLSMTRKILIVFFRIVHLIIKGFRDDECSLHAAALTFNTLMAIVPVLALSLALARVFGGDELARAKLKGLIKEWTDRFDRQVVLETYDKPVRPVTPVKKGESQNAAVKEEYIAKLTIAERIEKLVDAAFEKVTGISFAALGAAGIIILLLTVIQGLSTVENTFNRVWGVVEGRSFWRRITDYLSVVIILPFLFMAASSLPLVEFACKMLSAEQATQFKLFMISPAVKNVLVLIITSFTFTFIIMFMPNVNVKLLPGIIGGFVTGILFLLWLWICASFQIWVAGYGRIYGSFALFPIMLAWVAVSWQIILLGAETAFSVQNYKTYKMEQGARNASLETKFVLAIALLTEVARTMMEGEGPFVLSSYSAKNNVPVRLLNEVVDELVHAGFIAELAGQEGKYVLLLPPDKVRLIDVFKKIIAIGVSVNQLGLANIARRMERVYSGFFSGDVKMLSLTLYDLAKNTV